ncbi:MAG TPA: galactokinase [Vicinamibacterales bacterium]|nr:galactokinase [Vicinamibacterales bacterium]
MPEVFVGEAPGRVNLIGEHTDYHEGFVLPTLIPQRTRVQVTRRDDRRVRVRSASLDATGEYEAGQESRGRGWLDYVQGVSAVLARQGHTVPGFDLEIESTVPVGAGVSSSAALTVSLLRSLRTMMTLDLDDTAVARLAQAVETEFVGAPVGIMDQMAVSVGRDGEALYLDTRTLAHESLPLPRTMEMIIIDSGVAHQHAGGGYVTRRRESFEAAALLGVRVLRDFDSGEVQRLAALPPLLARRARHVITENGRVRAAAEALRGGDHPALGQLFADSQRSMRDDYEISTPDVDALVAIAQRHPAVFAVRMTGGGFGGAVVMLARAGTAGAAALEIRDEYTRARRRRAAVLVPMRTAM